MSKAPKHTTKRKPAQKSQYDLYKLPFFDKAKRLTWAIKPTGNYEKDCETGGKFARQFLASCDGTAGWTTLLGCIVSDIVRMGPARCQLDGSVSCGGIVIGFFAELSRALVFGEATHRLIVRSGNSLGAEFK